MRVITAIVLVSALTFAIGGLVHADLNLVTNPGFENWTGTSTADNWTLYKHLAKDTVTGAKATAWAGTPVPTPAKYHGGAQAQMVKVDYKNTAYTHGGVYQQINDLTAGKTYRVSAWIAVTQQLSATNIWMGLLGVDAGQLTDWSAALPTTLANGSSGVGNANWANAVISDGVWVSRSIDFTLPVGATSMTIFLDGYRNTNISNSTRSTEAFFDDVSVTALPEPTGFIALLTGLPLMGYAIRRRK
jgi:hypothetical protein